MSTYDWYKVYNKQEFEDSELVSREVTLDFEGLGEKTIMLTKGNETGVLFDDVFLPINLNERNPYEIDDRAVYVDDNDDIWVGVAIED